MSNSKLFQNMNTTTKPKETVKAAAVEQSRPAKRGKYKQDHFKDTNLKISTHQRNMLVALTMLGKAMNQKQAINYLLSKEYGTMSTEDKKLFDQAVEMLDAKYKKLH